MKDKLEKMIIESFKETVEDSKKSKDMVYDSNTVIFGKSSPLDSLGLVNFLITLEQKIDDEFDK